MTREEIIQGLQFTIDMFLSDPLTGEPITKPRNDMDKTTIDACKGAIEELQDNSYELWKESYEVEHERNIRLEEKIKALEQEPCVVKIKELSDDEIKKFEEEMKKVTVQVIPKESCDNAVSRQAVLDAIAENCIRENEYNLTSSRIKKAVKSLPPVTPQPKTGYISIDDVMSVFDDFMCGEVDEDGTNTFLEMLKDKVESKGNK